MATNILKMAEHIELGILGEQKASEFLLSKGYLIRQKNWRYGNDEVDIVAETEDYIIIAEVKTRKSGSISTPEFSVNKRKQNFLIRAAQAYAEKFEIEKEIRFDVVAVIISNGKTTINHIENAFYPVLGRGF